MGAADATVVPGGVGPTGVLGPPRTPAGTRGSTRGNVGERFPSDATAAAVGPSVAAGVVGRAVSTGDVVSAVAVAVVRGGVSSRAFLPWSPPIG